MMHLMGFSNFGSTSGVCAYADESERGASTGAARVAGKARRYRQYMNRKGGFNRVLDAPRKTI